MLLSEKKEFKEIDIFRLVAALFVVSVHIPLFKDINETLWLYETGMLSRLAVPFFFITTGFFMAKKLNDKEEIKKYIIRILKMSLIYFVLYLPIFINKNINKGIIPLLKKLLFEVFISSYYQFWYFRSSVIAIIILYILINKTKLNDKKIFIISLLFLLFGILGNAYWSISMTLPLINRVVITYLKYFKTTRNGIFFGFPFMLLGYFIKKYDQKIKKKNYFEYFLISLIIMFIESTIIFNYCEELSPDFMFMSYPTALFLFLAIAFKDGAKINDKLAINSRKMSVIIYSWHILVVHILGNIYGLFNISLNLVVSYFLDIIICVVIGLIILKLASKHQFFKNFY